MSTGSDVNNVPIHIPITLNILSNINFDRNTESKDQLMLNYLLNNSKPGDLLNILSVWDAYCWNSPQQWQMNLGDIKGSIIDKLLIDRNPNTILELGTYCGYSSARFSKSININSLIVTIDVRNSCSEIAGKIHSHAGLDNRIKRIIGDSCNIIPKLKEHYPIFNSGIDFIFIDHWKDVYLRDLLILEQCGLIVSGTIIMADNCLFPGCPDYLDYMKKSNLYKTELIETQLEYCSNQKDILAISIRI